MKGVSDGFSKRFAEKTETKKALRFFESRIHELLEQSPDKREGEDAMIARKYLGGWSCLSCEKALEKLRGKLSGHQSWNKLPRRDPTDRIAKAGPGFSKMLATFQPDFLSPQLRPSAQARKYSPSQFYEEEVGVLREGFTLPPVKGPDFRPISSQPDS